MTPLHLGERSDSKYRSSCVDNSTKNRSFQPPPTAPFFSIQPLRISETGFSGATSSSSLTHFCSTSSLSAASVHLCSGRIISSRRHPGGPSSQTPRAFLMSMKPSSHGQGSSDFQRRSPSDRRSKVAVFQQACPSALGTCIFNSATSIDTASCALSGGSSCCTDSGFSTESPHTATSCFIHISCVLADSARSCQTRESVTMEISLLCPLCTSSTSPKSITPPSETSAAWSSDLK
mmetsp:Transcript_52451/g.86996  ORF Transcript_52451/g.86996 Transcript_52451/m.86996 type:complete len:234 (+) Transcript_52451:1286-1987(+)